MKGRIRHSVGHIEALSGMEFGGVFEHELESGRAKKWIDGMRRSCLYYGQVSVGKQKMRKSE